MSYLFSYLHIVRTGLDLEYVTGLELAGYQRRTSMWHVMHGTSVLHLPSDIASADFMGPLPISSRYAIVICYILLQGMLLLRYKVRRCCLNSNRPCIVAKFLHGQVFWCNDIGALTSKTIHWCVTQKNWLIWCNRQNNDRLIVAVGNKMTHWCMSQKTNDSRVKIRTNNREETTQNR